MAKICDITGKHTIFGNSVSKANNKTRRKFYPNLQKKRFLLQEAGIWLDLRVSTSAIRTINKYGIYQVLKQASKKGTLTPRLNYLMRSL